MYTLFQSFTPIISTFFSTQLSTSLLSCTSKSKILSNQFFHTTLYSPHCTRSRVTQTNKLITFDNSNSSAFSHKCLTLFHHLDFKPTSCRHAFPISDTIFSPNNTITNHNIVIIYTQSNK